MQYNWKIARFEAGVPADPTKNMSEEDKAKWQAMNEEYGDKFKTAASSAELKELQDILKEHGYDPKDAKALAKEGMGPTELEHRIKTTKPGGKGSLEYTHNLHKLAKGDEKHSRYEEGKPADPTENMSQEDAKKWKAQTEEHKDEVKSAGEYNPWVKELHGEKAVPFSDLDKGASFYFPTKDKPVVCVKIGPGKYKQNGHTFSTGQGSSVIPIKNDGKTAFVHAKPAKAIIDELFKEADRLYDARVPFRYLIDTLQDLYGDPTGLNDYHGYNDPAVKKVRDCMQELDRNIGDTARQMEYLARTMRDTVKTAKSLPKGDYALVQHKGMDDVVLSVHKTQEEAEKAMRKRGGEPNSIDSRGMRVVNVGPKGKAELLEVFDKLTIRPKTASTAWKV